MSSLAGTLIYELNEIDQDFILMLDDYHMIREKAVHDLIVELLIHPPEAFIWWWLPGGILLFQFLICEPVEK